MTMGAFPLQTVCVVRPPQMTASTANKMHSEHTKRVAYHIRYYYY